MKHKSDNIIGWYGVLAILLAYVMVSFGFLAVKSLPYQLLNLSGAVSIVIEALSKGDAQPAVLNIVWGVIALVAILRITLLPRLS